MVKIQYPNINDDKFYIKINKIYSDYKIKNESNKTIEDICKPKQYKLQLPQKFLAEFMSPKTPYNGILIYHRIGSGKTCTAIRIAEKWKTIKKILVVLPASLKGNFRTELRSMCADDNYLKENERHLLNKLNPTSNEYKNIIEKSDARIDQYYKIYSYNKFIELSKNKTINLKNSLLIIDEVQNMVSEDGSFYETLYDMIKKSPNDLRIVLLSATPMFDKPSEIALTLNLLKLKEDIPVGKEFDKTFLSIKQMEDGNFKLRPKNMDLFKKLVRGKISYFRGAPKIAFPKLFIKFVDCEMSDLQYDSYRKILKNSDIDILNNEIKSKKLHKKVYRDTFEEVIEKNVSQLPNNFYIGTRVVSNIVFPNKHLGKNGLKSLSDDKILNNLEDYSIKFFNIMEKIQKGSGKIFVYSAFKEYGGIKSFVKVLEAYGYSNYAKNGAGKKRYAVWSGDEKLKFREEIKAVYNKPNNLDGSQLKIIIGSIAIREGISFTGVRQVHLLEPYWNESRLLQIIGRASRFCSHVMLPEEKRNVKVYIYIASHPKIKITIDQYMQTLITQKSKTIMFFEKAIKEIAVDCTLNKNANQTDDDEEIICEK
jgi:superfamily II DNA or RNA helicase